MVVLISCSSSIFDNASILAEKVASANISVSSRCRPRGTSPSAGAAAPRPRAPRRSAGRAGDGGMRSSPRCRSTSRTISTPAAITSLRSGWSSRARRSASRRGAEPVEHLVDPGERRPHRGRRAGRRPGDAERRRAVELGQVRPDVGARQRPSRRRGARSAAPSRCSCSAEALGDQLGRATADVDDDACPARAAPTPRSVRSPLPRRRSAAGSRTRTTTRPRRGTPRRSRRRARRSWRRRASDRRRAPRARAESRRGRSAPVRSGTGSSRRRASTPSPRRVMRVRRTSSSTRAVLDVGDEQARRVRAEVDARDARHLRGTRPRKRLNIARASRRAARSTASARARPAGARGPREPRLLLGRACAVRSAVASARAR